MRVGFFREPGPIFSFMTYVQESFPVHVEYTGHGEWESTGLDFSDYSRMKTVQHKLAPARRLETPLWAINDSSLREVLVCYVERRAGFRRGGSGTLKERLAAAEALLLKKTVRKIEILTGLCQRFRTITDSEARRKIEIEIENLDTQVRLDRAGSKIPLGVVFYYYRCGMDSVAVGQQLGLKPPHVRAILWRLSKAYELIQNPEAVAVRKPKAVRVQIDMAEAVRLNREGATQAKLAAHFGCTEDTIRNNFRTAGVEIVRHCSRAKPGDRHFYSTSRGLREERIKAHAAKLKAVADQHGGVLPPHKWLRENGFGTSYVYMMRLPQFFEGIQREHLNPHGDKIPLMQGAYFGA